MSYGNVQPHIEKPKAIITGATAYSRNIDYKRFREIVDNVGALLIADIAHPAGLVVKRLLTDPILYLPHHNDHYT